MSKRRPFFIGTNRPILNVQKTFILGRVLTGFVKMVTYTEDKNVAFKTGKPP